MDNDNFVGVSKCVKNFTNCLLWAKRFREIGLKNEAARCLNDAAKWRKEVVWWKSNHA